MKVLKILRFILGAILVVLSLYSIFSNTILNFDYMMFILGLFIFISGTIEYKAARSRDGSVIALVLGFILLILSVFG